MPNLEEKELQEYLEGLPDDVHVELVQGEPERGQGEGWIFGWFDGVLEVRIAGEILGPANYLPVFEQISRCEREDTIKLYVNSNGGDLDTALAFINALQNTEASSFGYNEGYAQSAGAMILYACDTVKGNPLSVVMVHTASCHLPTCMYGTKDDHRRDIEQLLLDRVFKRTVYQVMKEGEIQEVIDGKDVYFPTRELI